MNLLHGILIRTDTHNVTDVYAPVWNGQEIRKKLVLRGDEIVYQDIRSDSIVVRALCNVRSSGTLTRDDGFELFGKRFYGNALIIPDEDRDSPRITPQEVAHRIRFFRGNEQPGAREEAAA